MILIYFSKRNFDTQKAERFVKERRHPFQLVDLKRHRLGRREVELFLKGRDIKEALDLNDPKVKGHPVAHTNHREDIIDYLVTQPSLLISPILRCGNQIVLGYDEDLLAALVQSDQ